jgi:UDP-N-acetyl-2-amino-2-deoxyglucuronate dehydrogenase
MTDVLRFGIIGCGRIAPRHADSILQLEGAQLVAVADVKETRAANIAGRISHDYDRRGVKPVEAHSEYRRLLDRKDVDVVNICTPSGLHAPIAIEAMEAGKHVIVEKPIALSLDDADAMIATSHRTGKRLCVVLQNRHNPPMRDLRRLIDENRLGRLLLGNACVRWYRPQEYYQDEWHGTWAMDGGALMNQSIHHIDALQWLMGDVETVFAYTATLAHQMEAEDVGTAVLRFKSGAIGSVEGSTVTWPENLEGSVAIFGERGSVKVGGTALNRKVLWKVDGELEHERELITHDEIDPPSVYGQSHKAVIQEMVTALREGREHPQNGAEARKSVAVVLAIYESSRTRSEVKVDFAEHVAGALVAP